MLRECAEEKEKGFGWVMKTTTRGVGAILGLIVVAYNLATQPERVLLCDTVLKNGNRVS